jgi:hypothetical protein
MFKNVYREKAIRSMKEVLMIISVDVYTQKMLLIIQPEDPCHSVHYFFFFMAETMRPARILST